MIEYREDLEKALIAKKNIANELNNLIEMLRENKIVIFDNEESHLCLDKIFVTERGELTFTVKSIDTFELIEK